MLKNLKFRLDSLWRQLELAGPQERRVLAALDTSSCQDALRVFAIENRWHLSFALTFRNAMNLQHSTRSNVIIYDQDLPGVDWRQGLQAILACAEPAIAIVLSRTSTARMYRCVLDRGAYALARKPVEGHDIVPLVNGALRMSEDINSLCVSESV